VIPAIFSPAGTLILRVCLRGHHLPAPSETIAPGNFFVPIFSAAFRGMRIPMLALLAFIAAIVVLLLRFLASRQADREWHALDSGGGGFFSFSPAGSGNLGIGVTWPRLD